MKKIIYLSILICSTITSSLNAILTEAAQIQQIQALRLQDTRNIAIFLEFDSNLEKAYEGITAVLNNLLVAIQQKAAPIMVNNSLWDTFVKIKKNFYISIRHLKTPEGNPCLAFYNHIEQLLEQFQQERKTNDPTEAAAYINAIYDAPESLLKKQHLECTEKLKDKIVEISLLCYATPFNPEEWSIFETPYVHLLIPKNYEKRLAPPSKDIPPSLFIDHKTKRPLNPREITLNLKISSPNIKPVIITDLYILPESGPTLVSTQEKIEQLLSEVFITKDDITDQSYAPYLPYWIVFLHGHGGYQKYIPKLQETADKIEKLHKKLGFVRTLQCTEAMKRDPKMKTYCENLKQLRIYNDELNNILAKSGDDIAGISVPEFKKLLQFLNNKINTYLFLYSTCYAAGKHLALPYISIGFPDIYNFTIIAGAISDNTSDTIAPYQIIFFPLSASNLTVARNNKLALKFSRYTDFNSFFYCINILKKEGRLLKSFPETINYVKPFKFNRIYLPENIPVIRFPMTPSFVAIPFAQLIKSITYITTSIAAAESEMTVNNKDVILLYVPNIPTKIVVDALEILPRRFPIIISMIPGDAKHFIQDLYAPTHTLSDVINGFISLRGLAPSKSFFIDKLTCLNNLSDEQSTLLNIQPGQPTTLEKIFIRNYGEEIDGGKLIRFCLGNRLFEVSATADESLFEETETPDVVSIKNFREIPDGYASHIKFFDTRVREIKEQSKPLIPLTDIQRMLTQKYEQQQQERWKEKIEKLVNSCGRAITDIEQISKTIKLSGGLEGNIRWLIREFNKHLQYLATEPNKFNLSPISSFIPTLQSRIDAHLRIAKTTDMTKEQSAELRNNLDKLKNLSDQLIRMVKEKASP